MLEYDQMWGKKGILREMELISVLMPTYNVEKFVGEAVESILSQTWTNFEFIIVDDCSQDNTYEILQSYTAKDSRIKLYRNDVNSKICKTLNRALKHAKGEYIVRMDGDDLSTPDRFEALYQYLQQHPDVDLVGSNTITINEDGVELGRKSYLLHNRAIQLGNRYMTAIAHIWMARRKVYNELHGYRDIPYAEDFDFLLRGKIKGFRYANVDKYLYSVRHRNGNTVSSNGLVQRKTVAYVKKIHRLERLDKQNHFNVDEYKTCISCSQDEQEAYYHAALLLSAAIKNKSNKMMMISRTIRAALSSSYIFSYLIDATMVRIIKKMENHGLLK